MYKVRAITFDGERIRTDNLGFQEYPSLYEAILAAEKYRADNQHSQQWFIYTESAPTHHALGSLNGEKQDE